MRAIISTFTSNDSMLKKEESQILPRMSSVFNKGFTTMGPGADTLPSENLSDTQNLSSTPKQT